MPTYDNVGPIANRVARDIFWQNILRHNSKFLQFEFRPLLEKTRPRDLKI